MNKGGLDQFLEALFASEGGTDYAVENRYGYIGKYQFGEAALVDAGYYKGDGTKNRDAHGKFKYDWVGKWTGKNGADSKEAFLASPEIQDHAAKDWVHFLCKQLHHLKLESYIGKTIGGVNVTESGIIAAAHLTGYGNPKRAGVTAFLQSNGATNAADANGTTVSKYMHRFEGYALGCCAKCAVQVLDRDKAPVAGLAFKLMAMGKELYRGITDPHGRSPFIGGFSAGHELSVWVKRLEGGYKEVARFAARHTPTVATLTSPKLLFEAALQPHAGPPGAHQAVRVDALRQAKAKGHAVKRAHGAQRNAQGNPVEVIKPPVALPPVADKLKRLQEVLLLNVRYGAKDEPLSGPASVQKVRKGEPISALTKKSDKSLGRCYQYVKVALQASGMVGHYLVGVPAKEAGPELAKEGYRNLLDNSHHGLEGPMDAPIGAVIVYETTDGSPYGHIEVRLVNEDGDDVVVSDYESTTPRTQSRDGKKCMNGRGRKVIGVWVKN